MTIINMVGGGGSGGYKSYTELKAMSLSDAITELNTDAQGYYDNLSGNGHIIGIGIANNDNTTYQCWDVSPIVYWNGEWRNGEIIIFKIKTSSAGSLSIPVGGYSTSGSASSIYNWWVSYNGGSEVQKSGTGGQKNITIATGLTADTEYTVVIRPNSESYLWARAFGFYSSGVEGRLTEIVYDGSYKGYGSSSTDIGDYFRHYQYRGCTALTIPTQEVLPSTVTSIGTYFRSAQYYQCTALTVAANEILPSSITTIGDYFRRNGYYGCTLLTKPAAEVLSNSVTSIGTYFRSAQYQNCTNLTSASQEVLPSSVTFIGTNFRLSQYRGCTSLTTIEGWIDLSMGASSYRTSQFSSCNSNKTIKVLSDVGYAGQSNTLDNSYVSVVLVPSAYLNNFINSTKYPRSSITDSKFVGY